MNWSRLRSTKAAPKLAMMSVIALPRRRSRRNRRPSTARARIAVTSAAATSAAISGQPKENGPIGAMGPSTAAMPRSAVQAE